MLISISLMLKALWKISKGYIALMSSLLGLAERERERKREREKERKKKREREKESEN